MADHRITDFVDPEAIESLKKLKDEMLSVKETYVKVAEELIKGIKIPVDNLDELDKKIKELADLQKIAADATRKHSVAIEERNRIVANTTNTISRELMELERVNKTNREAYTDYENVQKILQKLDGEYDRKLRRLVEVERAMKANTAAQKELNDKMKNGATDAGLAQLAELKRTYRELAIEKGELNKEMKMDEKINQSAEGSYRRLSVELEKMKNLYKQLTQEDRENESGKELEKAIQNLDAYLKDMAADVGEFQRNVGNYAIACSQGQMTTEELRVSLAGNAVTVADCIEQNKALEDALKRLDSADVNYAETVKMINERIDENKRKILDVESIMSTEAKTVAEAEQQNKQLAEAIKLVDYTTEEGKKKIAEYNRKIEENKRAIADATPALKDNNRELENQRKQSAGLIDQLGSLIGVNTNFGRSLEGLKQSGGASVFEGLKVKAEALGKTLLGMVTNPWILAILGITGVVAGFKWWYDYNKGLVEATKLTRDFTGKSGADLRKYRTDVQAVADYYKKDFKEVLNATDKMASQLGISYEEALSAIKEGFIADADAQGDFLSNIERYAPALRDAGVEAREMVAIIAQTRSGQFSEDGLRAIQVASDRLKRMPKATKDALSAIGMSSDEIQKALNDGSKSMMDVIQEVSGKLKEFPENSNAYGEAIYNVFGRKAAAGGALLMESIADINTDLDKEKEKLGELGELEAAQLESHTELRQTMNAVFDSTGGFFEKMTAKSKIYINQGLVVMIRKGVDLVNWVIRMYNNSEKLRTTFWYIVATVKTLWAVCKFVFKQIAVGAQAIGEVIEGITNLDGEKIKNGYAKAMKALKSNFTKMAEEIGAACGDAYNKGLSDHIDEFTLDTDSGTGNGENPNPNPNPDPDDDDDDPDDDETDEEKAKKAKDEIKRINDLEEAKLKAMKDGHEKELAQIRFNYNKKIREITGNTDKEKQARLELTNAMNREIDECNRKYQEKAASIDLANRLAAVKKGSKEELDLKLEQLENARQKEVEEADKTGADIALIEAKYAKQRQELLEEYANARIKKIQDEYATEAALADNSYNSRLNALNAQYAEQLKLAGTDAEKREEITRKHEEEVAKLSEEYARQRAEASVKMLNDLLTVENISDEERKKLEEQLAKAKIELEKAVTEAVIAENQRQIDSDSRATEKRIENAQKWLQQASEALNAVNDLASSIFDAKIERIEAEQEANTEAGEAEQERIADLVEKQVITEEEGEARKRAAADKTAKKDEELEKKKQQLQYKQAVWDKANQLAQAGINTAVAILASAKMGFPAAIPFVAMAAALGAIQMATIIATPIPKYAKGTDSHPGGLAVVGDGGKREVVSIGGDMFLTPDKPILVDMPRGAQVFPDADKYISNNAEVTAMLTRGASNDPPVVVNNDYRALERKLDETNALIKRQTKVQRRNSSVRDYDYFKATRGL